MLLLGLSGRRLREDAELNRRRLPVLLFFVALTLVVWSTVRPPMTCKSTTSTSSAPKYIYKSIPGLFRPSVPPFEDEDYDFTRQNLGLMDIHYETDEIFDEKRIQTQWERFKYYVEYLNAKAAPGILYKVLYLGRHGEGIHNVAERTYGTSEWESHWAKQEGNRTLHWADALLTPIGIEQVSAVNNFWSQAFTEGAPPPDKYYTSPLRRCLQTVHLSFAGLPLPQDKPLKPVIKEMLRETIGRHTCDRRSSRSEIEMFLSGFAAQTFVFEPGFAKNDELWEKDARETDEETQVRLRKLLDDIFENEPGTWISITSHSGANRAILAIVGHRYFRLDQGSVMAVLVKAERVRVDDTGYRLQDSFSSAE